MKKILLLLILTLSLFSISSFSVYAEENDVVDLELYYIQQDDYVYISVWPLDEIDFVYDEVSGSYFVKYDAHIHEVFDVLIESDNYYKMDYSYSNVAGEIEFLLFNYEPNEYHALSSADGYDVYGKDFYTFSTDTQLYHYSGDQVVAKMENGYTIMSWRFQGYLPPEFSQDWDWYRLDDSGYKYYLPADYNTNPLFTVFYSPYHEGWIFDINQLFSYDYCTLVYYFIEFDSEYMTQTEFYIDNDTNQGFLMFPNFIPDLYHGQTDGHYIGLENKIGGGFYYESGSLDMDLYEVIYLQFSIRVFDPIPEIPIDEENPPIKWWEDIFNFSDYNPIDYVLSGLATVTVGVVVAAIIISFKKRR